MAPKSKQADRRANKKGQADIDDGASPGGPSQTQPKDIAERAKTLIMKSVIVQNAPKVPTLAQDAVAILKGEKTGLVKKEKTDEKENAEPESKTEESENAEPAPQDGKEGDDDTKKEEAAKEGDFICEKDVCAVFNNICSRLHWSCPLGLASPASGEESLKAWKDMKNLELDFGPRSKKKGNPGLDRIVLNLFSNLSQYLHVLLILMTLRAFFFRSFFACLPWCIVYQLLSVSIDKLPMVSDKVPLDKVPIEARIVIAVGFNGLVQLFFVYELFLKTYWLELLFLYPGLVAYHAYAVRPQDA